MSSHQDDLGAFSLSWDTSAELFLLPVVFQPDPLLDPLLDPSLLYYGTPDVFIFDTIQKSPNDALLHPIGIKL